MQKQTISSNKTNQFGNNLLQTYQNYLQKPIQTVGKDTTFNAQLNQFNFDINSIYQSNTIKQINLKSKQSNSNFIHKSISIDPSKLIESQTIYQNKTQNYNQIFTHLNQFSASKYNQKLSENISKNTQNLHEDNHSDKIQQSRSPFALKQGQQYVQHVNQNFRGYHNILEDTSSNQLMFSKKIDNNDNNSHKGISKDKTLQKLVTVRQQQSIETIVNSSISKEKQSDQGLNRGVLQLSQKIDGLAINFSKSNNFNTIKKQTAFKKKDALSGFSAPQLKLRRSVSINDEDEPKFQAQQNPLNQKRIPETQVKLQNQKQNKNNLNMISEKLGHTSSQKQEFQLNYSQSGLNCSNEILHSEVDSLRQCIKNQQTSILNYKQTMSRLEQENNKYKKIIQQKMKMQEQNNLLLKRDHLIEKSYQQSQTIAVIRRQQIQKNRGNNQNFDDFENKNLIKQDAGVFSKLISDHPIQKMENFSDLQFNSNMSNQHQNPNNVSHFNLKLTSKTNLEQKVEILELQKSQLINKIDWLNSVIEDMMSMGQKIKTDKSIIMSGIQTNQNRSSKRSRQQSGDMIGKVSTVIQTSFIEPIPTSQFNYKSLYQKEIGFQHKMKNQIQELQQLQNLYQDQFQLILKEIGQIKKNRTYYQQLKKQIKKSQSLNKDFWSSIQKTPHLIIRQSDKQKRVFENQIIYHLKTENQNLHQKYTRLKQLYLKQKVINDRNKQRIQQQNFIDLTIDNQSNHRSNHQFPQKNVFQKYNRKNDYKILQNYKDFNHQQQIKRPYSYANFPSSADNTDTTKLKFVEQKRKNGSITVLSHPDNNKKNQKLKDFAYQTPPQYKPAGKPNSSASSSRGKYEFKPFERQFTEDQMSSKMIEISMVKEIVEEDKQRSKDTNQTRQNIINRYNNFIKNMKQKFGINSAIIGKPVSVNPPSN